MDQEFTLTVNQQKRTVSLPSDEPLLYVLRDDFGLNGPKFGCGLAQCGACTVIMDGKAVRSCVTPVSAAQGHAITTLEGLGSPREPDVLQASFIEEQAVQCGYCINGMIMTAKAFLDAHPNPDREAIQQALAGNLCRCGTHTRIIRAVERAASLMSKE